MRFLRWLKASFDRYAPGAGLVLPWVGGVLIFLAAVSAAVAWLGIRTDVRATATVTENIADQDPLGSVFYSPRLRFRTPNGELIQVLLPQEGSAEAEFPTGTTVSMLYPAGHPEWARIATTWRIYWIAIILAVLGVVLFDLGLILRILLRRRTAADV